MGAEVEQYVRNCGKCITRKALPQQAAPLKQITSQGPLDLVCIDFLSLESDSQGFSNILVLTDHFTRYAQAFPAKDQMAATVAKILCERYRCSGSVSQGHLPIIHKETPSPKDSTIDFCRCLEPLIQSERTSGVKR